MTSRETVIPSERSDEGSLFTRTHHVILFEISPPFSRRNDRRRGICHPDDRKDLKKREIRDA